VAQIETQGSRTDTATAFTVDEIAALFGIPVTAVRERLARRAVPQEYFSIPDLAKRWRYSRPRSAAVLSLATGKVEAGSGSRSFHFSATSLERNARL